MRKSALLVTCAFGALSFSAGGAFAATAAATTTAAAAQPSTALGEVVVTAERREANLQNVPEAVTAFTSKQRNLIGINTVQDITNFTPGLTYSSQLDRPAMRGISKNSNDYLADSGVAIYYDDFYSNSTFLVGRDDMLIDQVEVLVGPQGTLYGRNSIGGLINTQSKKPDTNELSGEVRAVVGNYGYTKFEGTVTGPITDHLSFRLSAYDINQDDGYFTNIVPGMRSEGGVAHDPYEDFQLQYKDDQNELWLDINNLNFKNDAGGPGGLLGTPTVGHYDTALTTSGSIFFNPNFPYGGGAVPGSVVGQIGTDNPALGNIRDFAHSIPTNIQVNNAFSFIFHATHHFDGFDAKYIGGYSQYGYQLNTAYFGNDNSPVTQYQVPLYAESTCAYVDAVYGIPCGPLTVNPAQTFRYATKSAWFSNELNFSSTTDSKLQWIAGLYQYYQTTTNPITVSALDQAQLATPVIGSADQPIGGENPLAGLGLPPLALANPRRDYAYENYQGKIESYAAYGQIDYKLNDQFKLTGGLRFTYDEKSGVEEARFINFSSALDSEGIDPQDLGSLMPAVDITSALTNSGVTNGKLQQGVTCAASYATTGTFAGTRTRCLGDNSDAVTGTAGVEWTPDRDTLGYLRYNRGYKAFGFSAGTLAENPYAAPEFVNDFEGGVKKTFGHTLTVDADAFYYDYQNDQIPIDVPTGGINLAQYFNIPSAASAGFELTANWRPIDHLAVSLTYGYNYTTIRTGCTAADVETIETTGVHAGACYIDGADPGATQPGARPVGPTDPSSGDRYQAVNGNSLPQAPQNKIALNANYTFVFDPGNLTLSGTFIWKDVSYGSVFNTYYYTAPSWNQVDLRAVWSGNHDRYEVILFMKNVFNSLGYDAAPTAGATITDPVGGGPATVGTSYDLTPPRTYGFEVHYKF
jgi:iron complex outermembrane recepter protein